MGKIKRNPRFHARLRDGSNFALLTRSIVTSQSWDLSHPSLGAVRQPSKDLSQILSDWNRNCSLEQENAHTVD